MTPKPRIYWRYYPKLQQGFWRVSELPKPWTIEQFHNWYVAHGMVRAMNNGHG